MSVVEEVIVEARDTTNRVARTFSIATRLLPRDVRDDVYCLYLVFRTLDDLVDDGLPEAEERVAAVEPTLHQSAYFRTPNRDRSVRGLYSVGGGTHPGAGIPGVLLGAEVTAGLVQADVPARRVALR